MQNNSLQETYIIDIKSSKYPNKPFYTFWNNMKETLPEVSIKLKCDLNNSDINIYSEFLFDDKNINNIDGYLNISSLNGAGSECSYSLNDSFLYIDKDICLDTKEGRCYKLGLYPSNFIALILIELNHYYFY